MSIDDVTTIFGRNMAVLATEAASERRRRAADRARRRHELSRPVCHHPFI